MAPLSLVDDGLSSSPRCLITTSLLHNALEASINRNSLDRSGHFPIFLARATAASSSIILRCNLTTQEPKDGRLVGRYFGLETRPGIPRTASGESGPSRGIDQLMTSGDALWAIQGEQTAGEVGRSP